MSQIKNLPQVYQENFISQIPYDFKEPTIYQLLNNSEEMILSLAEGNKDKFKELASAETNNGALVDFIRHLLREYRSQRDILLKIFTTHLEAFHELGISSSAKVYYESLARVLDADLWQFFAPALL